MLLNIKKLLKYLSLMCAAALAVAVSACSSDGPRPPEEDLAPRTLLVYMVANNSLGSAYSHFDVNDIDEMEQAAREGSLGKSRLIVFHQSKSAPSAPELIEITSRGQKVLKIYDLEQSTVSEAMMNRVISDAKSLAPAKSYGLVLWSHASGWLNVGIDTPKVTPRAFGEDGSANRTMSVTSLANVLTGKGFDYIYFDCCFMASAEVAYELRKAATWMVASAAELPANGTPYQLTLPYLMPEKADCIGAARATCDYYKSQYNPQGDVEQYPDAFGCTFSLTYLPAMEQLAQTVKSIYSKKYTIGSVRSVQQFGRSTHPDAFADLRGFAAALNGVTESEKESLDAALDTAVPYRDNTAGIHYLNSFTVTDHCGLTTLLPVSDELLSGRNYKLLQWYNDVVTALL